MGVTTGNTTQIPKEYSQTVFSAVAGVYENIGHLIPFLMNNFETIASYHGSQRLIAQAISYLGSLHSTETERSIVRIDDFHNVLIIKSSFYIFYRSTVSY